MRESYCIWWKEKTSFTLCLIAQKGREEEKIARTGEGKRRRKEIFPSVFGYRGKRKERKEIKKKIFF